MEELNEKRATWLDVVKVAARRERVASVRIHPAGGDGGCLALSLNRRLVQDDHGRVTIFRNREAALRFLALSGGEPGLRDPARGEVVDIACGDGAGCLCLRRGKRLQACPRLACRGKAA